MSASRPVVRLDRSCRLRRGIPPLGRLVPPGRLLLLTRRRSIGRLLLLGWVVTTASGCASLGVKAWERDQLSRREMRLDSNPTDSAIDDHIYFSKEASSGGRGFGGGGCGCN